MSGYKNIICLLLILNSSSTFAQYNLAQYNTNCFAEAKMKHDANASDVFTHKIKIGDTIDDNKYTTLTNATKDAVIGCKYPGSTLINITGKAIDIDKIKTNYTLINLYSFYDGNVIQQIAELDSLKKELKNKLTVICLFSYNKNDIKGVTTKYNNVEFITNADEYIKYHNLGLGAPTTFVLDKNKVIKYVTSGTKLKNGVFYTEIKNYLK